MSPNPETQQVFPYPAPHNGAGGTGAGPDFDASCPMPGGGVHKWMPRTAAVRAHKTGIVCSTYMVRKGMQHTHARARVCLRSPWL